MDIKRLRSFVISVILLIFTANFVTGTVKMLQKGKRLTDAKKELESLEARKAGLEEELEYRRSSEFVEEEARNKLNMVKPGEDVYLKPKILGDELLGAQSGPGDGTGDSRNSRDGFFAPITRKINSWFDSLKDFLLLFREA